MKCQLGLIKIDEEGQKITFLDELCDENFKLLEESVLKLHAYKTNQNLHNIFMYNFIELSDFFQETADALVKERVYAFQDDTKSFEGIYIHSNRLFLNFLSSFRTLVDYTSTYFSRKYGKKSEELLTFTKKTNELYDEHFEYRFMYKLRNYAQHCGFPISSITFNQSQSERSEHTRTGNLNAFFERELLLKDFDWGVVKKDLLEQPEQFPAMWTVGNFYRLIEILFILVNEVEMPSLTNTIEIIEKLCKYVPKDEGEICVFYDFEMSNPNSYENSKFKTLTIPWNIIHEINTQQ